jgi:hypothetical protein
MADEVTPTGAALELMRIIAFCEGKNIKYATTGNANAPSRAWILTTYAQCLETIASPNAVQSHVAWEIPK